MIFFFFFNGITDVDFSNRSVVIRFVIDWIGVCGKFSSSPISSTPSSLSKPTIVSRTSSMSLSSCVAVLAPAPSTKSLPTTMLSSFQYFKDFPLSFFVIGLDCKTNTICINLNN
ncbi:hypothetical protein AMTRI_Chr03g51590 [Amborella trichopoda]